MIQAKASKTAQPFDAAALKARTTDRKRECENLRRRIGKHKNPESAYDIEMSHVNSELDESLNLGIYYSPIHDDFFVNVKTQHGERSGYSVVSVPLRFFKEAIARAEGLRNV